MKVAVLGCGPAGLMAAHAIAQAGVEPIIFSRKQKSPLFGAQYLHAPIPGAGSGNAVRIEYSLRGTPGMYRRKVYGPMWDGTVSPEDLEESHAAWDIRQTYDNLWEMYHPLIQPTEIDPAGVRFLFDRNEFDFIINTIPLSQLCHQGHAFRATEIVAAGDAPQIGVDVGFIYKCDDNTVVCNGESSPSWYRLSRIFDHTTVEWPISVNPPLPTASKVMKPLGHLCDCWPDLIKVGRYGSWEKGVLSHDAYLRTKELMECDR